MNRLGMQAHNFAQMEELETLVLASNKLLALHSSVWALTTLQRLDLGHNNLSDLPAEVSSLTGLTVSSKFLLTSLTCMPAADSVLTSAGWWSFKARPCHVLVC
jgi:Leucine-rich repeat (LRR) protein